MDNDENGSLSRLGPEYEMLGILIKLAEASKTSKDEDELIEIVVDTSESVFRSIGTHIEFWRSKSAGVNVDSTLQEIERSVGKTNKSINELTNVIERLKDGTAAIARALRSASEDELATSLHDWSMQLSTLITERVMLRQELAKMVTATEALPFVTKREEGEGEIHGDR